MIFRGDRGAWAAGYFAAARGPFVTQIQTSVLAESIDSVAMYEMLFRFLRPGTGRL